MWKKKKASKIAFLFCNDYYWHYRLTSFKSICDKNPFLQKRLYEGSIITNLILSQIGSRRILITVKIIYLSSYHQWKIYRVSQFKNDNFFIKIILKYFLLLFYSIYLFQNLKRLSDFFFFIHSQPCIYKFIYN